MTTDLTPPKRLPMCSFVVCLSCRVVSCVRPPSRSFLQRGELTCFVRSRIHPCCFVARCSKFVPVPQELTLFRKGCCYALLSTSRRNRLLLAMNSGITWFLFGTVMSLVVCCHHASKSTRESNREMKASKKQMIDGKEPFRA